MPTALAFSRLLACQPEHHCRGCKQSTPTRQLHPPLPTTTSREAGLGASRPLPQQPKDICYKECGKDTQRVQCAAAALFTGQGGTCPQHGYGHKTRPPTAPAACPCQPCLSWVALYAQRMHRCQSHDAVRLNIRLVYGILSGRCIAATHRQPCTPLTFPAPHMPLHLLQLFCSSTCILHSAAAGSCRSWGYLTRAWSLPFLTPIRHTITQPATRLPKSSQPASLMLLLLFLLPPSC